MALLEFPIIIISHWIWKECLTVDTTQWQKPTFQTHSANTTWIIFEELIQVKASQNNETFLKHTSGFSKSTQQSWCRAKRFKYVLEKKPRVCGNFSVKWICCLQSIFDIGGNLSATRAFYFQVGQVLPLFTLYFTFFETFLRCSPCSPCIVSLQPEYYCG